MKFVIKGPFKENIYKLMRKISYHFLRVAETSSHLSPRPTPQGLVKDEQKGEFELARPSKGYPRFHLFLKIQGDNLFFNLHLDQKKPTYEGTPAHSGEYDGELVSKEVERIKETLSDANSKL